MGRRKKSKIKNLGLALVFLALFMGAIFMGWLEIPDEIYQLPDKLPTALPILPELPDFTSENPFQPAQPVTGSVKAIYFCPDINCENALIEQINTAETTVHCALYDLDLQRVKNAFLEADARGVDVKIVSDLRQSEREKSLIPELMTLGLAKTDLRSGDYMHNKFCVVDNEKVWVGSFNTTFNGANRNNNNAVLIESPALAENFSKELAEMWRGEFGGKSPAETFQSAGSEFEVYFCPEDHCAAAIERFIDETTSSIDCMFFSFTLDELGDKFVEAHAQGINVRMIFESRQVSQYSEFEKLDEAGVAVIKDGNPNNMHNKLCIFDNSVVLTGSMNPSKHSEHANDESVLFIRNPETAQIYSDYFENYWQEWQDAD